MLAALSVTPLFVGAFALLQLPVTIAVGLRRARTNIHFFDGGDVRLLRLMRAHGNFTETVPMTLLAMAAAELQGAPTWLIAAGGCALLLGRAVHYATILGSGFGPGRAAGMVLTLLTMATFGLYAIAGSIG
jgi:uncharacterized membrane protein YecN with MAPEG domain